MAICLRKVILSDNVWLKRFCYFRDEEDIKNSPCTEILGGTGDVKYRDLNGDKVIDSNDQKAIGYSTAIPEIYLRWYQPRI